MFSTILQAYLLNTNSTITPITNGLINNTYKITTPTNEHFVLQKINEYVFTNPYIIESNIKHIASYLEKKHPQYFFTKPLKLPSGNQMMLVAGEGYFRIFPFVADSHSKKVVQTPQQAYEAAAQFGKFTSLLNNFDVSLLQNSIPDFHHLTLRYQQFEEALQKGNPNRIAEVKEEIIFLQSHKNIAKQYNAIVNNSSFKFRVTHHDTKISNVLFDSDDKALCVIDLDTIMPGYFISDLGDMFRTYLSPANEEETDFTKIKVRKEYYDAIVNGYLSFMKDSLTDQEMQHIHYAGEFMIYMQALRFLTDYLNNDIYYGAKYEAHNYNRAKNQIVLLQKFKKMK